MELDAFFLVLINILFHLLLPTTELEILIFRLNLLDHFNY